MAGEQPPDPSLGVSAGAVTLPAAPRGRTSHLDILASTSLIGGATLLMVAVGIVRTKLIALLLGPAGIGLMSLYTSIVDITRSAAGMGLGNSGVRQIAEAAASDDAQRIARTATVVRRSAVGLGLIGAAALWSLSEPVSSFSFGNPAHAGALAVLSLAVLFQLLAEGQTALLQGTRRIGDMARVGVLGALLGTACSVTLVLAFGERGIAPALVSIAAASAATAWWYGRRLPLTRAAMPPTAAAREAANLLKLGVAFMVSGFLMMGAGYAARLITLRELGIDAAGLYQAAWAIGGLYVGFVLQAMGADFYPRLVAVVNDHAECNRLVNEQAHVSLLIAGPGVIATLVLAPAVLAVFYSAHFAAAVEVLRWLCLGVALRVVSWPMGFIIVAKNSRALFIATEIAWTLFNVASTWLLVKRFGLAGAGIAFFASYVFHALMLYPIVRRLSGFRWSAPALRSATLFTGVSAALLAALQQLPMLPGLVLGSTAMVLTGLYSLHALVNLVPASELPSRLKRWIGHFRPAPNEP